MFLSVVFFAGVQQKNAPIWERKSRFAPSSFVFLRRIWHLTHGFAQVAGFHRAVPSTALDKVVYVLTRFILYKNAHFVKGQIQ